MICSVVLCCAVRDFSLSLASQTQSFFIKIKIDEDAMDIKKKRT